MLESYKFTKNWLSLGKFNSEIMTSNYSFEGNYVTVSGALDGAGAAAFVQKFSPESIYTLDFKEVVSINFAALRTLLRSRQGGGRFCIINACEDVARMFEETGVSSFVNVCRAPRPLDLSKYTEFGAGYMSKALNSEDGDSMLKVYGANVPKSAVAQEKAAARAVMLFGIPTPLVGSLYEDGDATGLDFERIEGKKSLSRIISEDNSRLEEITRIFARMCKDLHSKQCDTAIFSDRTVYYRDVAAKSEFITEEEKRKVFAFIDTIPADTTCLHGDMQPSNVITNGTDYLWIDLGEFGYGFHMLDMGMWYFMSNIIPEHLCQHIFHLSKDQMGQIWGIFSEEYFGADTPEKKAAVIKDVEPYAALHMLYIGSKYGFEDGMLEFVREKLLK